LRALLESSTAFVSDYDVEAKHRPRHWRRSLATSTWIVAQDGDHVVGLARSLAAPGDDRARYIECVWVQRRYRHQHVLRKMLEALESRARLEGATHLLLWVLHTNPEAEKAYDRLGFRPSGRWQPLPTPRGPVVEVEMWKALDEESDPLTGGDVPLG
jgi:ribosomal protein S18 acetylase RimI-like enzyme